VADGTNRVLQRAHSMVRESSSPLLIRGKGEACVGDLVAAARLPRPTVSNHLALLRRGGVAESRRAGKHLFYRVATPLVAEVLRPVGEG
jgi:ArsR family transcriptional regulator